MYTTPHLQLMDAGMSNNLPIYPLLRPGRDVDVIVAFDASADVKTDNWIRVVDGYVRQRGIKGWPMGAGWPPPSESSLDIEKEIERAETASANETSNLVESSKTAEELGHCTVWVGTKQEREGTEEESSTTSLPKRLRHDASDDWHLTDPNAGIALVYFPFLANPKVPSVDPTQSDFMSTWNFVYTPDEIDKVVQLARANFDEGQAQTKRVIRAVWERKKKAREAQEREERDYRRSARIQRGSAHRWRNADHGQGDQFGGV
jgi:phospholipase A2